MAKINYTFLVQQETQTQVQNLLKNYVLPSGEPNLPAFRSSYIGSAVTATVKKENGVPVTKEDGTPEVETRLDYERAFDILRWGKDATNPYAKQNPETWENDYDAAMALLQSEVKAGGVEAISRLPGRIAQANQGQLVQFVQQARQERIAEVQAKIDTAKADETRLIGEIRAQNEKIAELQSELAAGATLDREQEIERLIGEAVKAKEGLVTQLETAIETVKTQTTAMTKAEKEQGKSEKDVNKTLKTTLKREKKEAKVGLVTRIKNYFTAKKEAAREKDAIKKAEKDNEAKEIAVKPAKKTWRERRDERRLAKEAKKGKEEEAIVESDPEALTALVKNAPEATVVKEGEVVADPTVVKEGEVVADATAVTEATVVKEGEVVADPNAAPAADTVVADPNAAPVVDTTKKEVVAAANAINQSETATTVFSSDEITPEA